MLPIPELTNMTALAETVGAVLRIPGRTRTGVVGSQSESEIENLDTPSPRHGPARRRLPVITITDTIQNPAVATADGTTVIFLLVMVSPVQTGTMHAGASRSGSASRNVSERESVRWREREKEREGGSIEGRVRERVTASGIESA